MNIGRGLWIGGWLVFLVLLQYSLRPLLGWRIQVDFLIIALLVIAVRTRPAIAAFCGFALGIITDSLTPGSFGAGALAMTLVGFASGWLKTVFFTENLALNALFVFLGKWAFDLVYITVEHRLPVGDFAAQALWWSPLAAALTAMVGLVVLVASRPPMPARRR